MEYVNLGRSGLKVSRICLGTMTYGTPKWRPWVLDEAHSRLFYRQAWEAGINFFDTADMYSLGESEQITGRALWELARREEIVLATKVFFPLGDGPNQGGLSRKHILEAAEASLRRLGTDYIDLYQIHRWDYDTPIDETLEALHDLLRSGKVRYIGASSMYAWQFAKALYTADLHGWTRFVSMQNHYNLVYREEEREMIPLCQAEGIGVIPWSPLARGFLAGSRKESGEGKTTRAQTDDYAHHLYTRPDDYEIVGRVATLAKQYGVQPAQIALAWLLHQPVVTAPIIGASKEHHLEEAVQALEIKLQPEDLDFLQSSYQPHLVLEHS